jgi:hypothetical protein
VEALEEAAVDVGDDGTVDAEYESCRELRGCR